MSDRAGGGLPGRDLVPVEVTRAVEALPGLARLTAATWFNVSKWGVVTSWKVSRRLVAAASDPEAANKLAHEIGLTVGVVAELGRRVADGANIPDALEELAAATGARKPAEDPRAEESLDLRERGADLLRRSRDLSTDGRSHPAYQRILDELAPDEARILVYLRTNGRQPVVDVRTGGPIGMVNSRLVADGLTMIGGRAGCRYAEEVPAYLNNLARLGLATVTRDALPDPADYQVLEAQPDVIAALHSVRLARVVRRSVGLTPFGTEFCGAVLTAGD